MVLATAVLIGLAGPGQTCSAPGALEISATQGALDYQDTTAQRKLVEAEGKLVVAALCG